MKAAPSSRADPLGLGHQRPADAALARAGVDDEGEDPDDPVVVLEPRQGVEGDEPEERAVVLGDDDPGVGRGEALEPGDDVARPGRVALVGEQRGDGLGVGGLGESEHGWWPGRSCARWYPPRQRRGAGADRADRTAAASVPARTGPASRRGGAGAATAPARVEREPGGHRPLVVARQGRGEAALGRGFDDRQRDAARQDRRGRSGSGRRAPPIRRRRRTRPPAKPRSAASSTAARSSSTVAQPTARSRPRAPTAGSSAMAAAANADPFARGRPASDEDEVRAPLAERAEPGPLVDPDRDGVLGEDPEVDVVARAARPSALATRVTRLPRPRPRAQPAVPIDDR